MLPWKETDVTVTQCVYFGKCQIGDWARKRCPSLIPSQRMSNIVGTPPQIENGDSGLLANIVDASLICNEYGKLMKFCLEVLHVSKVACTRLSMLNRPIYAWKSPAQNFEVYSFNNSCSWPNHKSSSKGAHCKAFFIIHPFKANTFE